MKRSVLLGVLAALSLVCVVAAQDAVHALKGVITKVDDAAKTIVVKTADGTEQTIHVVDKTVVHGARETATGAKNAAHGLTEGTEVVAHYTEKGTEKTAVEVDNVGKGGLKAVDGTVTHVGEGGKTVVVKTADGTEQTFHVVGRDTADTAKDIGKGTDKGAKYTVYYTEKAGKKVAHFFAKLG